MIPIWFTVIVLLNLLEFILTSKVLNSNSNTAPFIFDILGRLSADGFFILPCAAVVLNRYCPPAVLIGLLMVITFIAALSSAARLRGIK